MPQFTAEVTDNRKVGPYMLLKLRAPEVAENAKPGQFIMMESSCGPTPLLRRPFGIHDLYYEQDKKKKPEGILVLYQVVGQGTELISKIQAGEQINIIGPLGNGFTSCKSINVILIAGGVGIAPLMFLAKKLKTNGHKMTILAGARSKKLLYTENIPDYCRIIKATDDGTEGIKGPITSTLENILPEKYSDVMVYASGPKPMLETVASITLKHSISCELSMEAVMACGIGACYGCAIKTKDIKGNKSYKRVCKAGPVFNAKEIIWT